MSSARAGQAQSRQQLRERSTQLLEQLRHGQQTVRRAVQSAASDSLPRHAKSDESSAAVARETAEFGLRPHRKTDASGRDAGKDVGRDASDDGRTARRRVAAAAACENDENSPVVLGFRRRPEAAGTAPSHPADASAWQRRRLPRGESPPASPTDGTRRRAGVDDGAIRQKLVDAFDEPRPSTPPQPNASLPMETPKSILKRRRIIDDNVPVASRLQHTPGWMERIGGRCAAPASNSRCRDTSVGGSSFAAAAAATHSRLRNVSFARDDTGGDGAGSKQLRRPPGFARRGDDDNSSEELTLDSGNYRPASVARAAETPRSALKRGLGTSRQQRSTSGCDGSSSRAEQEAEEEDVTGAVTGAVTASPYRGRGKRLASARHGSPAAAAGAAAAAGRRHPMLGYDWIAALLDNEETPAAVAAAAQLPDDFFDQLRDFRRQNKDECVSLTGAAVAAAKTPVKSPLLTPSKQMVDAQAGDLPSPNHTCIHNYTVNQRLFAKPTNADETGKSRCPVCWRLRRSPTTASPGFVRVSIPRATLMTPYKVRPHRRKSFDPSDSYALSKHCLAGWENQRPPPAVVARNVDLANETNRLKTKWTSTIKEAEELALKLRKLPLRSRDLDTTTLYTRQLRQIVDDLHNI